MKLWTWHESDFSLLDGQVDYERSEYAQEDQGLRTAYRELASHLGTSQFIWCYTIRDERVVLDHHTKVEWTLEVPSDEVLCFVEGIVWNRILEIKCGLPNEIRRPWTEDARRLHPDDRDALDEFVRVQTESFWAQPPPSGGWWDWVFTEEQARECVWALVPHPYRPEWVVVNPMLEECR